MRAKLNWIFTLEGGNPLVWRSMKTTCYKGSLTLLSEVSMGKMIYGKGVEIQPPQNGTVIHWLLTMRPLCIL